MRLVQYSQISGCLVPIDSGLAKIVAAPFNQFVCILLSTGAFFELRRTWVEHYPFVPNFEAYRENGVKYRRVSVELFTLPMN